MSMYLIDVIYCDIIKNQPAVTILEKSAILWKRDDISARSDRRLKRTFSSLSMTITLSKKASTGGRRAASLFNAALKSFSAMPFSTRGLILSK